MIIKKEKKKELKEKNKKTTCTWSCHSAPRGEVGADAALPRRDRGLRAEISAVANEVVSTAPTASMASTAPTAPTVVAATVLTAGKVRRPPHAAQVTVVQPPWRSMRTQQRGHGATEGGSGMAAEPNLAYLEKGQGRYVWRW